MNLEPSRQFRQIIKIWILMKICPVRAELFHAEDSKRLIVAFRNFAKAPENYTYVSWCSYQIVKAYWLEVLAAINYGALLF